MIMKHYNIMKYIICDLSGERCGEDRPYNSRFVPVCDKCEYFIEWGGSGLSVHEYHKKMRKKANDDYLNCTYD